MLFVWNGAPKYELPSLKANVMSRLKTALICVFKMLGACERKLPRPAVHGWPRDAIAAMTACLSDAISMFAFSAPSTYGILPTSRDATFEPLPATFHSGPEVDALTTFFVICWPSTAFAKV